MRRGRYYGQPAFPFVPGYDLVGTVQATGPGADPDLVGHRVAALTKTGGWASHSAGMSRAGSSRCCCGPTWLAPWPGPRRPGWRPCCSRDRAGDDDAVMVPS